MNCYNQDNNYDDKMCKPTHPHQRPIFCFGPTGPTGPTGPAGGPTGPTGPTATY